jgi:two-component system chemotaxis sensor kinase CheA
MEKIKNRLALIVDDEERNVFALRSYLEALEMKTIIAHNGEEAILMLQDNPKPDIILLDIMMPVMDGYETLEIIRQTDELKSIPVIAVTARAMKGDEQKCLEAGAWDYISKPVNMNVLIEKMNHWMV